MNKRQKTIDCLVDCDLDTISTGLQEGETDFLNNILLEGWKGYNQMTNKELEMETKDREIDIGHYDSFSRGIV